MVGFPSKRSSLGGLGANALFARVWMVTYLGIIFMVESNTVLLIEDNENDALLMRMALAEVAPTSQIVTVPEALSAITYLGGGGIYADRATHPLPYLVICDLMLPGIPGLKLISWIRNNDSLKHLLIIALTGALHAADYAAVYAAGADTFMHKSPNKEETMATLSGIYQVWIRQKVIPPGYSPMDFGKEGRSKGSSESVSTLEGLKGLVPGGNS
jgi:CheY-like chemotaxis protein